VLQHSRTLTSPAFFNASVEHLQDICTAIKRQHSGLSVSDVIVLRISACPHIIRTVQDVLCSRQWKVFNHAVYSLDFCSSRLTRVSPPSGSCQRAIESDKTVT
jgi:hypothetical protein